MKKRLMPALLLGTLILLSFINFASAQLGYGGYGFSLSDFLYRIDSSTMFLLIVFLISFALLYFLLTRTAFRQNIAIASVISFALALGITYGINYYGFDLSGLFFAIGISEDAAFTIASVLFFGILLWAIIKKKVRYVFLTLGLLLIILAFFTNAFYEKGMAIVIGVVLSVIGLWLWSRHRKKEKYFDHGMPRPSRGRRAIEEFRYRTDPSERLERYQEKVRKREEKQEAREKLIGAKRREGVRRQERFRRRLRGEYQPRPGHDEKKRKFAV